MGKPDPWSPIDVLRLLHFQSWEMSVGWSFEQIRAGLLEVLKEFDPKEAMRAFSEIDSKYNTYHPRSTLL